MKRQKNLPQGWYIEGTHLHSADGFSRCVKFGSALDYERIALCLTNYGRTDFAALWMPNAAQLIEVLKEISELASKNDSDICQNIRRRADHAISFANQPINNTSAKL